MTIHRHPSVLLVAEERHPTARLLEMSRFAVTRASTIAYGIELARSEPPDLVLLDAEMQEDGGVDACQMFQRNALLPRNVPFLVLMSDKPSPQQLVAGLRAGTWEYLTPPFDHADVLLVLETFLEAKRNMALAHDECLELEHGRLGGPPLARHARSLGEAMARRHGALACVVFALRSDAPDRAAGRVLAGATRVSDVVGALSPTEVAVLAPATDGAGAERLIQRVVNRVCASLHTVRPLAPGLSLWAGYDAVANLTYTPMDPAHLLTHAAMAVRAGQRESDATWMRRFDVTVPQLLS